MSVYINKDNKEGVGGTHNSKISNQISMGYIALGSGPGLGHLLASLFIYIQLFYRMLWHYSTKSYCSLDILHNLYY